VEIRFVRRAERGVLASLLFPLLALTAASGCSTPLEQNQTHVPVRQSIPVSVCTEQLAPVKSKAQGKAVIRDLDPAQWLEIIIPQYEEEKGLEPTALDCTGHYVFANESLRGGASDKGWPRTFDVEDMTMQSGPGGMRVFWARTLKFDDNTEGGPIALVRAIDDRAEVYGVGSYRGHPGSKLTPVRAGNDVLVIAETKECDPENPGECRKRATFFLPRRGRLIEGAAVDLERIAVVPSSIARGLFTRYRLTTDITYRPDGILLLEQVDVRIVENGLEDKDSGRHLRTVEFGRILKVERDSLFSSNEPLWDRVVGQD
jgi:hypothetical protein